MARLPTLVSLLLALPALLSPAPSDAACRQALALGLDVSSSVDDREYRMQLDGLADALLRPEVQQAFLSMPGAAVRLYVFEWAGSGPKRLVLDWREIATARDLAAVAGVLRGTGRAPMGNETALGEAMLTGGAALQAQGGCWRRTLDISGDGQSNAGPRPRDARRDGRMAGLTVNGLVVGTDPRSAADTRPAELGGLLAYYRAEVILGPDAFTEVARGYADYERAMARKLLKELQFIAVSGLDGTRVQR